MEYRIIRGAKQIGGTVTEIVSDAGTKIWIDFGCELSVDEDKSTDRMLISLMQNRTTRPDVVFFTHIHGDHIGLLSRIPDDVDIVMSEIGKKMMDNKNAALLSNADMNPEDRRAIEREDEILNRRNTGRGRIFFYRDCVTCSNRRECRDSVYLAKNGEEIHYRALKVDHSVYGAYMLRFDIDGKVLVHTGDFRAHGRLGSTLIDDIKSTFCREGDRTDILITEGTMMSRDGEAVLTEEQLKDRAVQILKKHKYAFLICSSTNLDSLASFYRATIISSEKGKKKPFLCNSYVKKQLELFTEDIGEAERRPEYRFYRSYPISRGLSKRLKNGKTQYEHIRDEGFVMMIGSREWYHQYLQMFADFEEKPVLIYSMWGGYLQEDKPYTNHDLISVKKKAETLGFAFEELHTSGHAEPKAIAEVIEAIDPQEAIVPIHTEKPEAFREKLNIRAELKDRIRTVRDYIVRDTADYNELSVDGRIIPYSSKIEMESMPESGAGCGKSLRIRLHDTTANMQTDLNDFESLAVSIWSIDPGIRIEIAFDEYRGNGEDNNWNRKSLKAPLRIGKNNKKYADSKWLHYFRFLYRIMRFRELFGGDRFSVADENVGEINTFARLYGDALDGRKLWITRPTSAGGLKGYDKESRQWKSGERICENHLEKWFALRSIDKTLPLQIKEKSGDIRLYDQLPCSIFSGEPSSENRIFSSGYFDLWGIDGRNELCLFELKEKNNTRLGIISELFFYAMIMRDMVIANKHKVGERAKNYRGFKLFQEIKEDASIRAGFLVPALHPFLSEGDTMKRVLDVLNSGSRAAGIEFDCIFFDQDAIVDSGNRVKRESFLKKLARDWEKAGEIG